MRSYLGIVVDRDFIALICVNLVLSGRFTHSYGINFKSSFWVEAYTLVDIVVGLHYEVEKIEYAAVFLRVLGG